MSSSRLNISAIVFGVAIVLAALLLGNAYVKRSKKDSLISVTGLAKTDFTSDLIVWEGDFTKTNYDLKQAYADLARDKKNVLSYLKNKGVGEQEIVFNAIRTNKNTKTKYSDYGKYVGEEFTGFTLRQTVQIKSKNVEQVEKISREITELLNKGVNFYSDPPRYYYTKLADLKLELISRATENARLRAEMIAENSKSNLGTLKDASMGVFQITGQHSTENYSWGGAFNTSSKEKTASITARLTYKLK